MVLTTVSPELGSLWPPDSECCHEPPDIRQGPSPFNAAFVLPAILSAAQHHIQIADDVGAVGSHHQRDIILALLFAINTIYQMVQKALWLDGKRLSSGSL